MAYTSPVLPMAAKVWTGSCVTVRTGAVCLVPLDAHGDVLGWFMKSGSRRELVNAPGDGIPTSAIMWLPWRTGRPCCGEHENPGGPSPPGEASRDAKHCGGRRAGTTVRPIFAELFPASVRATARGPMAQDSVARDLMASPGRAPSTLASAPVPPMPTGHDVGTTLGATAGFFTHAADILGLDQALD
ncbi:hypothetical protein R75465_00579 [Paraburkholderia aspalathi]|nr:hypothetical protein R75465_00579 [Paraburkholderia aspalathi]